MLQDHSIGISVAMIRMEQLLAKVTNSRNRQMPADQNMGDLALGLETVPCVPRLHAHQPNKLLGL